MSTNTSQHLDYFPSGNFSPLFFSTDFAPLFRSLPHSPRHLTVLHNLHNCVTQFPGVPTRS